MSLVLNFGSKGICVPHDFIPGCSYIFECLLIPIVHWTGREFVSHRDELSNHFLGQSIIISFHWTFVSPRLAIGFWDRFIRSGPLAQAFSHSRPSQHSRLSRQATGQAVPNRFNWSPSGEIMVALVRCCARPVLRGEILGKVKSGGIRFVYLYEPWLKWTKHSFEFGPAQLLS